MLIAQITAENEKLLQERRRLLQKITDQEETPWSNRSTTATLQSRYALNDLHTSGSLPLPSVSLVLCLFLLRNPEGSLNCAPVTSAVAVNRCGM